MTRSIARRSSRTGLWFAALHLGLADLFGCGTLSPHRSRSRNARDGTTFYRPAPQRSSPRRYASSKSALLATEKVTAALSDKFFESSLAVVASATSNPFRYFKSSPETIPLAVLMYVKYPLSLRNVEDFFAERGIDISHETVRIWRNRFGSIRRDPKKASRAVARLSSV